MVLILFNYQHNGASELETTLQVNGEVQVNYLVAIVLISYTTKKISINCTIGLKLDDRCQREEMRVYLNLSKIYDKEDTAQLAQLRRIKSLIRGVTEFSTVRLQDESDIRLHEWLKRSALPMSLTCASRSLTMLSTTHRYG